MTDIKELKIDDVMDVCGGSGDLNCWPDQNVTVQPEGTPNKCDPAETETGPGGQG